MKKLLSIVITLVLIFTTIVSNIYALESDSKDNDSVVTEEQETESEKEYDNEIESQGVKENIENSNEQDSILPRILYSTHVQDIGWQTYVEAGNVAGTSGKSKRLEAIKIKLDLGSLSGGISYSTHI